MFVRIQAGKRAIRSGWADTQKDLFQGGKFRWKTGLIGAQQQRHVSAHWLQSRATHGQAPASICSTAGKVPAQPTRTPSTDEAHAIEGSGLGGCSG